MILSQVAFALGACGGLARILMPSAWYRFKTCRVVPDLLFVGSSYAARWYSLITPPSTVRR
jgi:hypothetical protein